MFATYRDLEKHKTICDPDSSDEEEEEKEEPPMKKIKRGTDEWNAWFPLLNEVSKAHLDTMSKDKKKYMKEGYTALTAKKKAVNDLVPKARKELRALVGQEWWKWHKLEQDPKFKKIEATAHRLRYMENMSWEEAWPEAMRCHKVLFEYLMPEYEISPEEEGDVIEKSEEEEDELKIGNRSKKHWFNMID
jgi:hypothetical protein